MRKASDIAEDIVSVVDRITTLKSQLYEAEKRWDKLTKELEHHLKYNNPITLK